MSNTKDPLLDLADFLPDEDPKDYEDRVVAQQQYGPNTVYWSTRRLWEGRLIASVLYILQMDWVNDDISQWNKNKCLHELEQDLPAILAEIESCGGPSWSVEYFWGKLDELLLEQRRTGKRFDVREIVFGEDNGKIN